MAMWRIHEVGEHESMTWFSAEVMLGSLSPCSSADAVGVDARVTAPQTGGEGGRGAALQPATAPPAAEAYYWQFTLRSSVRNEPAPAQLSQAT